MIPYLKPGDRIISSSIPYVFTEPKVGDIVLYKNNGKMMVKRLVEISSGMIRLEGDNKADSLKIGWIKREAIKGKFLFKLISRH